MHKIIITTLFCLNLVSSNSFTMAQHKKRVTLATEYKKLAPGNRFFKEEKRPSIVYGLAFAVKDSFYSSLFAGYYLLTQPEVIKRNPLWSALFGSNIVSSFIKGMFPKQYPKNCIIKTIIEEPFFACLAGHTLIYHREYLKEYPLTTLFVGGTLLYSLATNYLSNSNCALRFWASYRAGNESDYDDSDSEKDDLQGSRRQSYTRGGDSLEVAE